ncbi:MAG TPA: ABC transporter permease, partial [Streptomyces sp.]|nr:ABC transporter permease [Streptomyces sp.]
MQLAADTLLPVDLTLGLVLAALFLAAVAVAAWARLAQDDGRPYARAVLTAGLRAVLQLAAVSAAIGWVVGAIPSLLAFIALMFAVAVRTAG